MNADWVGVVGAAVGGLIAVAGQWLFHRLTAAGTLRKERRDFYVDFVAASNHGIRVAAELRKREKELADANLDVRAAERLSRRTGELVTEADVFLKEMDRALAGIQLASPVQLVRAGRLLRNALDQYAAGAIQDVEITRRYSRFVALAHIELEESVKIRRGTWRALRRGDSTLDLTDINDLEDPDINDRDGPA